MSQRGIKSYDVTPSSSYMKGGNPESYGKIETASNPITSTSSGKLIVDRGNWSRPIEFIFACMNFAIGLANVWRYPYLAFR